MVDWKHSGSRIPVRARLAGGAVALLLVGGAAGASVVSHTRPSVEMAPPIPTAIAKVPQRSGVVMVKGKVAEVYGGQFIMQDGSGRMLIDAGPGDGSELRPGDALTVQGRYDNGQLRATYLVDPQGHITDVGAHARPPHGPGHAGPPPPPGAAPIPAPPTGIGGPPASSSPSGAGTPPAPAAPAPADAGRIHDNPAKANPQLLGVEPATR